MNTQLLIKQHSTVSGTIHHLPSSKSLSNRALLINAMMGGRGKLENLSEANDTRLMTELLHTPGDVINVEDAGTVMRFLTAYYAITGQAKVITGTARMQKRPIGELVEALRLLGCTIEYGAEPGYPPLNLKGFTGQQSDHLRIRGDISSQFISALMMVAPSLPKGLTLQLTGKIASRPYLEMTATLMKHFGVSVTLGSDTVRIPEGSYQGSTYRVEPDWSAASYWFSFAALAESADILLPHVESSSLQGDRVIVEIMSQLGVRASFGKDGLRLQGGGHRVDNLTFDFTGCPDLAQTVLPCCAALGVKGVFTGLESLRLKETDRILALQNELAKVGSRLEENQGTWTLTPGSLPRSTPLTIHTYEDHRMAMGFAPLATCCPVVIENPSVVNKSYPGFWDDLQATGFTVN
ncbi:MAG: 3-phosphoshikimate 1-carboxyvinyltransferase [Cyclobacteriaceae bacterium]|nr:3-phosphoshikimate 1-carboxyvinyltransferase [Cyclobacteriaceae bacterium]